MTKPTLNDDLQATTAILQQPPNSVMQTARCGKEVASAGVSAIVHEFATIATWCAISGLSRSVTYELMASGNIATIKVGARTLVHVPPSLAWMRSLPPARIGVKAAA